jgi:hypothetical protein
MQNIPDSAEILSQAIEAVGWTVSGQPAWNVETEGDVTLVVGLKP